MLTYHEVLNDIRARPQELLGEESCELIQQFVSGCGDGGASLPGSSAAEHREFAQKIRDKYALEFSSLGCFSLISIVAGSGAESFRLFFDEWDEFMKEHSEPWVDEFPVPAERINVVPAAKLLEYIRAKPPLLLGQKSLRCLRVSLDGRLYGMRLVDPTAKPDFDLAAFEQWLCQQKEVPVGTRLERLGTVLAGGDERGFDWFFENLDRWTLENQGQAGG